MYIRCIVLTFAACLLIHSGCRQRANSPLRLTVDASKGIRVFDRWVNLEDIQPALLDSLVNMESLPDTFLLDYKGEVLMGMRAEVETEVAEALFRARASRITPVVISRRYFRQSGKDCEQPDTARTNCATIDFDYPQVYFREKTLSRSVEAWAMALLNSLLSGEDIQPASGLEEGAASFFKNHKELGDSPMAGSFIAQSTFKTLLKDSKFLTLEIDCYSYQGGAHGNPGAAVASFDINSGKQLDWNDLVTDTAALKRLAERKFREVRAYAFQEGFAFDEIFAFKLPDNFGLAPDGLYFHYVPYEVAPYALGSTVFTIDFEELGALAKAKPVVPADPEQRAIGDLIHRFYRWYGEFQGNPARDIQYTIDDGKHLRLDPEKVDRYFASLRESGCLGEAFFTNERAILKKCESLWQDELPGDIPSCLDHDRFFCAQDWDINFWTQSPVTVTKSGDSEAMAVMAGQEGGIYREQTFEVVKENGKWLISRIHCGE